MSAVSEQQARSQLAQRTGTRAAPRPSVERDSTRRARRALMLVTGGFLALVGGAQVTFELLSYYAGAGPLGALFEGSPYAIGWVENHGLALLIGLLFLAVASRDGRRFWHVFAIAVHVLLGAANITFWSAFVAFDTEPLGAAATVAHLLFVLAHGHLFVSSRTRRSGRHAEPGGLTRRTKLTTRRGG